MKSLWRLLMIALLLIVLPMRGYAMPAVPCCAEGTGGPAAQAAQHNVVPAVAVHGCESDSRAKGSLNGIPSLLHGDVRSRCHRCNCHE